MHESQHAIPLTQLAKIMGFSAKPETMGRFIAKVTLQPNTMRHGRLLRSKHGFFVESALEMIDRIEAIPRGLIEGILRGMPDDWMAGAQRNDIVDAWSDKKIAVRLSALRAGIKDGSLI